MKRKKYFLLKSQRGGMLMELMMSVAIAAILIPFIFRYQQNAVERARNISIAKQMEIVQAALERYIIRNRTDILNQSGNSISMCLENLAGYGISPEFINEHNCQDDCQNGCDYGLRILKYGNPSKPVLQGVVLLNNGGITALRTRQVANFGGGRVGYVDGTQVYGGFNVFKGLKKDYGLGDGENAGILGTTRSLRNSSIYLWRKGSDASDGGVNATMLSPLNINNFDIINTGRVGITSATFANELYAKGDIGAKNSLFTGAAKIGCSGSSCDAKYDSSNADAYVYGPIGSNKGTFNTNGKLLVTGSVKAKNLNVNGVSGSEEHPWPLTVQQNASIASASISGENPTITVGGYMAVSEIAGDEGYIIGNKNNGIGALTEFLQVKDMIYPTNNQGSTGTSSEEGSSDGRTQTNPDDFSGVTKPVGKIRAGSTRGGMIMGGAKIDDKKSDIIKDGEAIIDDQNGHGYYTDEPDYESLSRSEICPAGEGTAYAHCWNGVIPAAILNDIVSDELVNALVFFHCNNTIEIEGYTPGAYMANTTLYTKYPLVAEDTKAFGAILGKVCKKGGTITVGEALNALDHMKRKVIKNYIEWCEQLHTFQTFEQECH